MAKSKNVLVVGLGRFGSSLVEDLWEGGLEVVVVDSDQDRVDEVKAYASAAYVGDATDPEVLAGLDLDTMDAVVVGFGGGFEAAVLCVSALRDLEVSYILARAETERRATILKQVGASRVVQPERDMGKRVANELIAPVTQELLDLAEHYRVLPWEVSGKMVGQTLREARLTERYEINVIGYRPRDQTVGARGRPRLHMPKADLEIQEGDTLLIVGEEEQVNRFIEASGE